MNATSRETLKTFSFRTIHKDLEEEFVVGESDIIGIRCISSSDLRDQYELLYVRVTESLENSNVEARTTFERLVVLPPSLDVVRHLSQSNTSLWSKSIASKDCEGFVDLHVVISTGSGGQCARMCFEQLLVPFIKAMDVTGFQEYKVHYTKSAETITDLTKSIFLPRAQQGVHQCIILLSGDGGLSDLLNAFLSSDSPMEEPFIKPRVALVPTGTGNALANSIGISFDHTLGLSTIFRGRPVALPLFKVQFSPETTFLNMYGKPVTPSTPELVPLAPASAHSAMTLYGAVVFSYGLHACLVGDSDTAEYRKHGPTRFQMAAKDLLFPSDGSPPHVYLACVSLLRGWRPTTLDADVPEEKVNKWDPISRRTHVYVLATLVSQLEKGFTISPKSQALDGKLRLVHFGPMRKGGQAILEIMQAAYDGGKHVEDERVGYEEINGIRIEFGGDGMVEEDKWRRVCVDGKMFQVGPKGWVTVKMKDEEPMDLMCLLR